MAEYHPVSPMPGLQSWQSYRRCVHTGTIVLWMRVVETGPKYRESKAPGWWTGKKLLQFHIALYKLIQLLSRFRQAGE